MNEGTVRDIFREMRKAILEGDEEAAVGLARKALERDMDPIETIEEGFVPGLKEMGRRFEEGDAFLPELMMAGRTMKAASDILGEAIRDGGLGGSRDVVVMGTVEGDHHEIGKNIVGVMLEAAGYEVRDLGMDVDADTFASAAERYGARLVGASALLTTTMTKQREVVERVRETVPGTRVMVGGAPVTEDWSIEIGADGYAEDAKEAVDLADRLSRGDGDDT